MIILRLRGALGNQIFSYCFARSIALKKKQILFIDKSPMYNYESQSYYNLNKFKIKGIHISPFVYKVLMSLSKYGILKFKKFEAIVNSDFFEKDVYDEVFTNKNIVLDGHWQSYKYFEKGWDKIENDLELKSKYVAKYNEIENVLKNNETVSVHVRRGDYMKFVKDKSGFEILGKDYYMKAIDYMNGHLKNPTFVFFSDDIEWVKTNLKVENSVFVTPDLEHPYNEIMYMSKCSNNIIANSTFSWWGAYLNGNQNKRVIAPKNWFSDRKRNINLADLIPESWIKM